MTQVAIMELFGAAAALEAMPKVGSNSSTVGLTQTQPSALVSFCSIDDFGDLLECF